MFRISDFAPLGLIGWYVSKTPRYARGCWFPHLWCLLFV